ncbi:PilZ domain-containing protein [Falsiroseomonas sp. HW251]|uniref:PilZ domain-containing protein n=1 Tax=Falsiroseomonas sp. HW251 TaxID=3390998 RepID=UPI003D3136C8
MSRSDSAWPGVERRAHRRRRVRLPATFLGADGSRLAAEVVDISIGGMRLAMRADGIGPGARGAVAVEGLCGPLPCVVLGRDDDALRLRFEAVDALREELVERLADLSWDPQRDRARLS